MSGQHRLPAAGMQPGRALGFFAVERGGRNHSIQRCASSPEHETGRTARSRRPRRGTYLMQKTRPSRVTPKLQDGGREESHSDSGSAAMTAHTVRPPRGSALALVARTRKPWQRRMESTRGRSPQGRAAARVRPRITLAVCASWKLSPAAGAVFWRLAASCLLCGRR